MDDAMDGSSSLRPTLEVESLAEMPRFLRRDLQILILVDPQGLLYAAGRLLAHCGYRVSTVFEEGHAVASVLQQSGEPHLLVTSAHVSAGFCVARLIHRLRQLQYRACTTYCDCVGHPKVVDTYRQLPVDRFLTVPSEFRRSLLESVAWLLRDDPEPQAGLSIFEI